MRLEIEIFQPTHYVDSFCLFSEFGAFKSRSCAGSSDPTAVGTLRQVRSFPNVDDLIHLAGPLTEDAVLKTLQARFYAEEFFVSILC